MQPVNFHQLLTVQIRQTLGQNPSLTPQLGSLLQLISATYTEQDNKNSQLQQDVKTRTDQLIASTSRAYSFLDSLKMGFIMTDVKPDVVLANNSVKTMLLSKEAAPSAENSAPSEWTLAKIDQILQPDLKITDLITDSLQTNQPHEIGEVNIGQFVARVFIAPMISDNGSGDIQKIGAVILLEDITEQKMLDRSKDEFLSIASHELRTPLTAIRGNSAMINKYYAAELTNPDLKEMINDIHESSVRLIELVNDFLDVSALEQGKMPINPETINLQDIVTDVVRELQNLCDEKGIKLISDVSVASAPPVLADRQRTKQVIYNLVGNAVKFTEQGSITISTQLDENFVYTSVTDTGRGMSPENQRLLFRKFQQASNNILTRDTTKGTGLGLYISKLIVEQSGGRIGLKSSELGKGTTFTFTLPRVK